MTRALSHRARGQALGLVGILMLALIGTVALVADWGVFYALQRELQSAADAGALAAAWYVPVCSSSWTNDGCLLASYGPSPQGICSGSRTDVAACEVAREFALANLGSLVGMCVGFDPLTSINPYPAGHTQNGLQVYVVHIDCNARHLMGNVLPNVPFTMPVSVNSASTIGYRGANGDVTNIPPGTPPRTLITRLFLVPTS